MTTVATQEQWAAARELHEGEAPSAELLAALVGKRTGRRTGGEAAERTGRNMPDDPLSCDF